MGGGEDVGTAKEQSAGCGRNAAVLEVQECRRAGGARSGEYALKGFSRGGLENGWAGSGSTAALGKGFRRSREA